MTDHPANIETKRLVGYFPAWAIHARNYHVTDIPADKLTHINYAFADISPSGDCVSISAEDDAINFPQLVQLKQQHPQIMTLISVGGAAHSANISKAAATADKRQHLAQSCVQFMKQHGFDGIDIDWEFPANTKDTQNYTALLAELRNQLDARGFADNRHYLLTIAAPGGPSLYANLELNRVHQYVDWINLMAYNFYESSSKVTNFDAPLYPSLDDQDRAPVSIRQTYNVDAAVKAYFAAGVPAAKIVLGVHFVGTGWKGVKNANNGLYQKNSGPAEGTWEPGSFDYKDLKKNYLSSYTRFWHEKAQVPWLYNPTTKIMISYEDSQSLGLKANYAIMKQLGGLMIWQLSADDEQHSLVSTVGEILEPRRTVVGMLEHSSVPTAFVVSGHIHQHDGRPLAGAVLNAIDQDLRGEKFLGKGTTNQDGYYEIRYMSNQLARADKNKADLILRVLNTAGAVMGASSVMFNAPQEATVDITIGPTASGLPSEYERLVAELEPLLVNITILGVANPSTIDRLADLKKEDIDFLTGETGEERTKIEFLAAAAVLQKQASAQDLNVPAAAFYGLAREGLSINLTALQTSTTQEQRNLLAKAIKDNLIPATLNDTLDQIIAQLHRLIVHSALINPPAVGIHSLSEVLSTALPSSENQATLLSLSINHVGSPEDFWKQLRTHPEFQQPGIIEKLQLTLQLGLLTQNHLPLIQELQKMENLTSPRDLVKLDRDAWMSLINKQVNGQPIGVPPGVPGTTPQEKATNYVNSIISALQAAFPTDTVAQIAAKAPNIHHSVPKFFANSPDFNIRTSHVDAYAKEHASTAFSGIAEEDQQKVVEDTKRLQRLFQLSTNADTLTALLNRGMNSAQDIANIPRKAFLAMHAVALGGELQAGMIYDRAQYLNARNLHFYTSINEALNGVSPAAIGDYSTQTRQDLIKRFPNYTELFGSLDWCDCTECRSVLSPAAYLVDLLQFLDSSPTNPTAPVLYTDATGNQKHVTPLDILLGNKDANIVGRRPDLQYLPLTCENTNTPLPYVDLVNEVLESYIALDMKKLDVSTAHDTGDATQQELDANPQYTNDQAYRKLDVEVYPFTLPFNKPVTVARAYLKNLGSSRYQVIHALQKDQTLPVSVRGSTAEYLEITPEEYRILTDEYIDPGVAVPAQPLCTFYGYPLDLQHPDKWKNQLREVPDFLRRTGITYTDLIELVKTQFINPSYPQGDALTFFQKIPFSFATLTQLVNSNFTNFNLNLITALQNAGITLQQLIDWSKANYKKLTQLIVLDAPDSACNLEVTKLVHLDGTVLSDLDLSKLHRFIRLWRKLGWSIADLDCTLTALQSDPSTRNITPDFLNQIAQIKQLQTNFNISNLQVLLALLTPVNTRGDDALYKKLFLSKAALKIDPVFQPNPDGSVLTRQSPWLFTASDFVDLAGLVGKLNAQSDPVSQFLWNQFSAQAKGVLGDPNSTPQQQQSVLIAQLNNVLQANSIYDAQRFTSVTLSPETNILLNQSAPAQDVLRINRLLMEDAYPLEIMKSLLISRHIPVLLAALRISSADLDAIRTDTGLADDPNANPPKLAPLTLANVSVLYSFATLAQMLKLRVPDILALKTLSGINPFVAPDLTIQFATMANKVKQSGFKVAHLNYIYRHLTAPPANLAPQPTTLRLMAKTVRDGLTKIAQDNILVPDPTGDLSRTKLSLLFDHNTVDQTINMINGSGIYSAPLTKLPDAIAKKDASNNVVGIDPTKFPASVANKISYDPKAKILRFQGAMAISEQTALLGVSTDAPYQDAMNNLFQQPIIFIQNALSGFRVYSAPLTKLPDAIAKKDASNNVLGIDPTKFPASVANKISYDPTAAMLRFQGAMTIAEQTALLGVSTDAAYQAAVNDLFQQPFQDTLSGFLDANDAANNLVRTMPSLDQNLKPILLDKNFQPIPLGPDGNPDPAKAVTTAIEHKFAYLLGKFMPYLITQLSHMLAKQIIIDALKLDGAMAQLLLETVLKSQADNTKPAIADLLALQAPGLTASYFTSNNLSGTPTPGTDATIAFDGSTTTLPSGMQSASWSGLLLAPSNGDFTFFVRTNGTVQMWVGDDAVPLSLTLNSTTSEWVSTPITFKAGQLYSLLLEVTQLPVNSFIELSWQGATLPKAIIPSDNLYPQTQFDIFGKTFTLLQKSALFINNFSLSIEQVAYISTHPSDFAGFNLNALPLVRDSTTDSNAPALFSTWLRVNDLATLQGNLPQGEVTLINVFSAASLADATKLLAQATGWNQQIITGLIGPSDNRKLSWPDSGFSLETKDFRNEIWLMRLQECVQLSKRLGASARQLFIWGNLKSDFAALQNIAEDIKKTVQGKYDPDTWLVVAKGLNDPLRENQRDALIAYLLPRMQPIPFDNPNQFFEYFLIDAEMSACMETSRVKQAISSVQLFVQRCLMNLEIDVRPSAIDANQWQQWRKNYRVWEANRKIFLHTETYIVEELRDNKSPFFKELEGELLQNEVTNDNVETALLNYLEKLDQVARLDIRGMYWQDIDPDTAEQVNILHIFGRTLQQPYIYFYRRLLNNGEWTAWEKVNVDIQGDHLIPIIWNRRLFIFWPIFMSKANSAESKTLSLGTTIDPPTKYWEIQLAWSEYKQNKWSPKQVSKDMLTIINLWYFDTRKYSFKTEVTNDENGTPHLFIQCQFNQTMPAGSSITGKTFFTSKMVIIGWFDIGGCTGDMIQLPSDKDIANIDSLSPSFSSDPKPIQVTAGAWFDAMMFDESQYQNSLEMPIQTQETSTSFLGNTPTPYRLIYPHQYNPYILQAPFFYQDNDRTYFVTPNEANFILQITNSHLVNVGKYINVVSSAAYLNSRIFHLSGEGRVIRPLSHDAGPAIPNISNNFLSAAHGAPMSIAVANRTQLAGNWASYQSASNNNWNAIGSAFSNSIQTTDLAFYTHYHSFVCEFMKSLTRQGIPALLSEANQSLGIPYMHSSWKLAFWGTVTAISEAVAGPACIIQGDFGAGYPTNFEAVVLEGNKLVHYWHDNSDLSKPWYPQPNEQSEVITSKATGPGWVIQSDYKTAGHGHLEVVVLEGTNLVHYHRDGLAWKHGLTITSNATGPGCIIQSDYKESNGNRRFDVLVLEGNELVHYYSESGQWVRKEVLVDDLSQKPLKAASASCIIQSDYKDPNGQGHFEVIFCEDNGLGPPYDLVHYYYDGTSWNRGMVITSNATGAGCLIQSDIRDGAHGNYEVVVLEGNELVHYWHDNSDSNSPWYQGQVITAKATGPACIIQSTFGRIVQNESGQSVPYYGNFEVAALEGQRLVHYWNTNNDHFEFPQVYQPTSNVNEPYPVEDVDFSYGGAYSLYNWELFFHVPMLIAMRLFQNQRHEDALKYLQYILNVTDDSLNEAPPARYWKLLPFKNTTRESIQDLMLRLDKDKDNGDSELNKQVDDWSKNPFHPHSIARMRLNAYKKYVFMKCCDICMARGDQLFQQNTIETINESMQWYIMVANMLGPRPQNIPDRGQPVAMTYADLRAMKLDAFSNTLVQFENEFPFSSGVLPNPISERGGLLGLGKTLYFCIPQNDKLLSYWDTVADRLFKIRHCMNIEGIVQQLPLFEPPIDPALLVQAAAQGVDLSSVLNDINSPLPYYRFSYMLQKALEMCTECRSFGASLLSALEKKDAEELALLRATHETNILNMMADVKQKQVDEANAQVVALETSWNTAVARYTHYQMLLGNSSPSVNPIDSGKDLPLPDAPKEPPVNVEGQIQLLPKESSELESSHSARDWQVMASTTEILAGIMSMIPNFKIASEPLGVGLATTWGFSNLVSGLSALARKYQMLSAEDTYDASHAGKMAGYFRRLQEWWLQSNLAAGEINQIAKQHAAAKIRVAIAQSELNIQNQQIQDAQEVQDFLTNKYTSQDLYAWTISDISAIYFQCYNMAYELAKKAERAYRFERGLTDSNFIQFGYWDSLRKGLQSGERLYLALKQMERTYQDQNKREYEITKNISLLLYDPLALIALKETGHCEIFLPEELFVADFPSHYMRRIKSVSLTIPCVVGPYTSINCTLTLLSNKTRISSLVGTNYAEDVENGDDRFVSNFAAMQSIATSHAQNDSGMFELNFHDERYLPFEGAGAISRWRIDLPKDTNAFDFNTLSDVVLHLKYTAREGGEILGNAAKQALQDMLSGTNGIVLARLFSLKHEFPTEWYQFWHPTDATSTIQLDLSQERFPFLFRGKSITVSGIKMFMNPNDGIDTSTLTLKVNISQRDLPNGSATSLGDTGFTIQGSPLPNVPFCELQNIYINPPKGLILSAASQQDVVNLLQKNAVEDIWIVLLYTVS